ncbi:hypothetical protein VIBNIFTn2_1020084 [Vibrio nigripulchritudo FTn2]|nr:hypothetical protein VIBNIFTn2_1020084 [Vibrio nigripulchritudo FTn2]CCN46412.1 hypothetical protein VIBNIMADA3020_130085 [Vibrio nigripulchritudo MADA3020]CCN53482.1 hypothetical protein VIBNIMADA3021_310085 [Vibrio nigripulchritudo MADA3021]CCN82323.1 hypothetical protein VIBNIBLFn1_450084 [Vibrio nigripulchritudo BLFn1]
MAAISGASGTTIGAENAGEANDADTIAEVTNKDFIDFTDFFIGISC